MKRPSKSICSEVTRTTIDRYINFFLLLIGPIIFAQTLRAQTSIPFTETWELGSFTANGWTVTQGSGQCVITDEGMSSNHSLSLGHLVSQTGTDSVTVLSPWIDATAITEGILLFGFDYKLMNPDSTKWPLLKVYCDAGAGWQKLYEFTYNASLDWQELRTDLTMAKGHAFRLMWVSDRDADTINGFWLIDNIKIIGPADEVYFPLTAVADTTGGQYQAGLSWQSPQTNNFTGTFTDTTLAYYSGMNVIGMFFEELENGYGLYIDNAPFQNAYLNELSFYHQTWGSFTGRSSYKVHVMNFETRQIVKTFGPYTTTCSEGWERHVPLNLGQFGGIDTLAVLIEPLSYQLHSCMPGLSFNFDSLSTYKHIISMSLYNQSFFSLDCCYELFFRLTFLTPEGKQITVDPSTYDISRWQQSLPLNYTPMTSVEGTAAEWTDTEVAKGWYSYYVTANYADGSTVNSDTVAVEMPSGQGIDSPARNGVEVVPNPIHNNILHLSGAESVVSAVVSDLTGRRLAVITDRTALLNGISLGNLAPGHYTVRLTFSDGRMTGRKFIVEQ